MHAPNDRHELTNLSAVALRALLFACDISAVELLDALGPLHGLPIGIKDLEGTEGLLTTYGSPIYRANVPPRDNALVRRLRGAGAIVVGKTNVPEMGAGANSFNPVWVRPVIRSIRV